MSPEMETLEGVLGGMALFVGIRCTTNEELLA